MPADRPAMDTRRRAGVDAPHRAGVDAPHRPAMDAPYRPAVDAPYRPAVDPRRVRPPRPVFLDSSGGRRRLLRLAGTLGGFALCAALALIGVAVSGATPVHLPGLPDSRNSAVPAAPPSSRPHRSTQPAVPVGPRTATTVPTLTPGPPSATVTATPSPTRRHVPTQTPPHPTKSR